MKRMKIVLILLVTSLISYCPKSNVMTIFEVPAINPYEAIYSATIAVESSGDPMAIGDKHLKKWSYGIVMIRQSRLDDYFEKTGIRYSEKDMFNPVKSKEVFMYYACEFHPWQLEEIARCWNGGPKGMRKKSTKKYYKLILSALEKS